MRQGLYTSGFFHLFAGFLLITNFQLLENFYNKIFSWLFKCEEIFQKFNLDTYGKKRIYGFLAERFLSYWFNRNYKIKELKIIANDLTNYKNL